MGERTDHARELLNVVDRMLGQIDEQVGGHDHEACDCHDSVWMEGLVDGLISFDETVKALRSAADYLLQRQQDGWTMTGPIAHGQVNLVRA